MNDEIKINISNGSISFINNGIGFSQFGVAREILDLITNLQEELKEEKRIEQADFKTIQNLEEENQNKDNKILELQQELLSKKLNVKDIEYKEKMIYKSRCEKAIPMLKELNTKLKDILKIGIDIKEISNIVNILNGGDK